MRGMTKPKYKSEAELCAQFMAWAKIKGWVPYPETAGWDILLVRPSDGYQIGIEAKLALNGKVLSQAIEGQFHREEGPDFRAVLVPNSGDLAGVAARCGLTVIVGRGPGEVDRRGHIKGSDAYRWTAPAFDPDLPTIDHTGFWREVWFERCPDKRHRLPEYVPDVAAGVAAPVQLTSWKICAIKIQILLERRGSVSRDDFRLIGIDYRRWRDSDWIQPIAAATPRFVAGKYAPNFRAAHPRNFEEIAADFDKWAPPPPAQQALI